MPHERDYQRAVKKSRTTGSRRKSTGIVMEAFGEGIKNIGLFKNGMLDRVRR